MRGQIIHDAWRLKGSWCSFSKAVAKQKSLAKHHYNLSNHVAEALLPVYTRPSDRKLLVHVNRGSIMPQRCAEKDLRHLGSSDWKHAGDEIFRQAMKKKPVKENDSDNMSGF